MKRDKTLTIRQADKGTCLVVMDTQDYVREGLEHLSDPKIYKEVDHNKTVEVAHKANWICRHYASTTILSKTKATNLSNKVSEVRDQQIYFLRKVHKTPNTIRPIVSGSSGPTEKLSGHLCEMLSPHLDEVNHLVRNSMDAINRLSSINLAQETEVLLVTLDVEALYLSIPQAAGIEVVLQRVVHTNPATSRTSEFKNYLRDALRVVIRDNHFNFANRYFDQIRGVAMGTRCAPPFANLFLASLEERALETWKGTPPKEWMRFFDDIFLIWTGGEHQLRDFVKHLNSQYSTIHFKEEHSRERATFLDINIFKGRRFRESGVLDTSLHIKSTNPQSYLHYRSCHPQGLFKNIIRGEILRTLRATSDREDFQDHLQHLLSKFQDRGYPTRLVYGVADTIRYSDREEYLMGKDEQLAPRDRLFYSVDYHPGMDYKNIREVVEDERLPFSPVLSNKRPPSLKDMLVRAKVHSPMGGLGELPEAFT